MALTSERVLRPPDVPPPHAEAVPIAGQENGRHGEGVLLSTLDKVPPFPGVSLVTACMNREQNLLRVIDSWLATKADEIVIVDWSSAVELKTTLAGVSDRRLKILRIDGEMHWVLSHAFNVALRFARHELVYKIDCDIELLPGFLEVNRPDHGEFVRGFWKSGLEHGGESQRFINGTFGGYKKNLLTAGYYDERIVTYGWDDSDLYARLSHDMGLGGRQIDPRTLRHREQSTEERIANQEVPNNRFLGLIEATEFEAATNHYYTVIAGGWGERAPFQDYMLQETDASFWRGRRITDRPALNPEFKDLAETLAAKELSGWVLPTAPKLQISNEVSVEFSRLMRDAHAIGKSEIFAQRLADCKNIIFVKCETGTCCVAARETLDILKSHYPSLADYIVVADVHLRDGRGVEFEWAGSNVLFAPASLIDMLSERLGAKLIQSMADLAQHLAIRASNAICVSITPQALVNEAIDRIEHLIEHLGDLFEPAEAPMPGSCLVTSLYDEHNLLRLTEYLACLLANLKVFERIAVYYESYDGLLSPLIQLIADRLGVFPGRLWLVPYQKRPTFEELFSIQASLPDNTVIAAANADVAFDATFWKIRNVDLGRHVVVLSRYDVSRDGTTARLIHLDNGAPNTLSADAWIVKKPFEHDFLLDYQIGTYHCDSFINYQLSTSKRYSSLNLCLDIRIFHLHDDRFNSSGEKAERDAKLIEERYEYERQRNGSVEPVRGCSWMTTASATSLIRSFPLQVWKPNSLLFNLHSCGTVSFGHVLSVAYFVSAMQKALADTVIVVRLTRVDFDGAIGALLRRCQAWFKWTNMIFDIEGDPESVSGTTHKGIESRAITFCGLIEWICSGDLRAAHGFLIWPGMGGGTLLRRDVYGEISTAHGLWIAEAVRKREDLLQAFLKLFDALPDCSLEKNLLTPFVVPQFKYPIARVPFAAGAAERPVVSFVTSLFQGGTFLEGYLENVVTAALEAHGEIILVDANPDDEDSSVIKRFLAGNPNARKSLKYIRLREDPGLYACWRLAIDEARADLITNANIDDRRCPSHTVRLVKQLISHPEYAGACGSISCVTNDGIGAWFSFYSSQIWFYGEGTQEIGFDDLYRFNECGEVRSRNILHCMPVWRKSLHAQYGYFDEKTYGTSADWAFWLKCTRAGERFIFDQNAFGQYFLNPQSHNRRNDIDGTKEMLIVKDLIGLRASRVVEN